MILTPLQKLPNNVGDLGKIIVATSFEWLLKVQKIAKSGHTGYNLYFFCFGTSNHTLEGCALDFEAQLYLHDAL